MVRLERGLRWLTLSVACIAIVVLQVHVSLTLTSVELVEPPRPEPTLAEKRNDARLLISRARIFEAEGDLLGARRRLRTAVQLAPELMLGWKGLGRVTARQGQVEEARHALGVARKLQPADGAVWFDTAELEWDFGDELRAMEMYQYAIDLGHRAADAHHNLATLSQLRGFHSRWFDHHRRSSELDPAKYEAIVRGVSLPSIRAGVQQARGLAFRREARIVYGAREAHAEDSVGWMRASDSGVLAAARNTIGQAELDADTVGNARAENTAGYFSSSTHRITIITDEEDPRDLHLLLAHEHMHAMQADHFPRLENAFSHLRGYVVNFDRALALRSLVEGDPEFVEDVIRTKIDQRTGLDASLRSTAASNVDRRAKRRWMFRDYDRSLTDAAAAVPVWGLGIEYGLGRYMVASVWLERGWEGVNELYSRPPETTEQCLHPEKLIRVPRDMPSAVSEPDWKPDGWRTRTRAVLGEVGMIRFLGAHGASFFEARRAAEGWDGDIRVVYSGPDGAAAIATTVVFDSQADANEFAAALRAARSADEVSQGIFQYAVGDAAGVIANREERIVVVVEGFEPDDAREFLRRNTESARFRD